MKIILTQRELRAGKELVNLLGVSAKDIDMIIKDNNDYFYMERTESDDITEEQIINFLNKNYKAINIEKFENNVGVVCYSMIISEEFIEDTARAYSGFFNILINTAKGLIISLKSFHIGTVKPLEKKWINK